jgi:hypothetical protein
MSRVYLMILGSLIATSLGACGPANETYRPMAYKESGGTLEAMVNDVDDCMREMDSPIHSGLPAQGVTSNCLFAKGYDRVTILHEFGQPLPPRLMCLQWNPKTHPEKYQSNTKCSDEARRMSARMAKRYAENKAKYGHQQ